MSVPTSTPASNSWFTPAAVIVLLVLVAAVANGGEAYDLSPSAEPAETNRVSVELEFGGELIADDHAATLGANPTEAAPPKRAPLRVEARLAYVERVVSGDRTARWYETAAATIEAGAGRRLPSLARDRRLIVADASSGESSRATLASPAGPLTREQLELIDIVGDAQALDRLLPGESLEEGGEWRVGKEAMARLLGLDSVAACEVRCIVDDGNKRYARFQMAGAVHGEVDAAATEFEVRAIGLFSRGHRQVTQLNLAMTEKRAIGPARPGVEGTAKLKIKRLPTKAPKQLADDVIAALADKPIDAQLSLTASRQGFRLDHDRRWRLVAEGRESVSLRRVASTGLVAQTTLRRQPKKSSGNAGSLKELEKEVRFSLGDAFVRVVSTEAWTNPAGYACLGLVVEGKADGVPLEWRYYVVAPSPEQTGADQADSPRHTIALSTTVEGALAKRVGSADRALADAMTLITPDRDAAAIAALEPPPKKRPAARTRRRQTKTQVASKPRRSSGVRRRR